jgi:hypothetical protein
MHSWSSISQPLHTTLVLLPHVCYTFSDINIATTSHSVPFCTTQYQCLTSVTTLYLPFYIIIIYYHSMSASVFAIANHSVPLPMPPVTTPYH